MNTEKAIRLYDAITEVREDWVEDALPPEKVRRHPHLRAGAAVAAIIPLVLLAAFALAHIPGSGTGRPHSALPTGGGTSAHVPGAAFYLYPGPVLPLTAEGEHPALTLTRDLDLDLETFYAKDTCAVTDTYTLKNTGETAETVTLLYPFAAELRSCRDVLPALTVEGEAVTPEPVLGPSVPTGSDWGDYLALLERGSFALPDPTALLAQPVVVYELRDCWGEKSAQAVNPTLSLEYSRDWEKSTVLSWGFNGSREEAGVSSRSRSVPQPGTPGYGVSAYVLVLGEDIQSPVLRAYTDGGCKTPLEEAGGTVLRWESTLGEMLALCCRWEPEEQESTLADGLTPEELAAALASYALELGLWGEEQPANPFNGMLEDVFYRCMETRRILLLPFTVTVPAGGSVTVTARSLREAAFDPGSVGSGMTPRGFDALSAKAGALPLEGETVGLRGLKEECILGRDLTPGEDKLRYWVEVQRG